MNKFLKLLAGVVAYVVVHQAYAAPVVFTKLTGTVGGTPAGTALYRADLSGVGLASLQSISIQDNSFGLGGSTGQFSGFDLDAIRLSNTSCADAACASGLAGLGVFDFSTAGTIFVPGTQRPPVDPKLFGTNALGNAVDNAVATLDAFDANSTTAVPPAIPSAFGFISLGDGGILSFNLTSIIPTAGLFLYIGEVGDNGEVAVANITVSDQPVSVTEPQSLAIFSLGLVLLTSLLRRRVDINK